MCAVGVTEERREREVSVVVDWECDLRICLLKLTACILQDNGTVHCLHHLRCITLDDHL